MTSTRDAVLRVDLSAGTVRRETVPERWRREFLGGKGLGARYLYEELSAGADPWGPENLLGFFVGPLSGFLPGESRYAAVTKSPLTGAFLDSYSGGEFAARLSGSLGDTLGLVVVGTADEPVRIELSGGEVTLSRAETWGADAAETAAAFPDAAVACVGPAGESGVEYATIASDGGEHHAGRGGAGAVMGAKRLKAIVAHDEPPTLPPSVGTLQEKYVDAYENHDVGRWQAAGETLESIDFANEVGVLPTEGWTRSRFDGTDEIGIERAREHSTGRERPDDAVPGGFRIETEEGETVPRGATPMTLGAGLGVDEFDAVAALGGVCDRLGVDVISAGNAVAWAVRAGEEGIADVGLDFGDEAGIRRLIEAIAHGTADAPDRPDGAAPPWPPELPALLGDGVDAAAAVYGGDDLIPTVKSMELPSYDPRGAAGMALAYATSDRGGCHRRARPIETEVFAADRWGTADRARAVAVAQDVRSVLWSLIADDFAGETMWGDLGAEWLEAIGLEYMPEELAEVGERVWTLVRLFNVREGFDRTDDELPATLTSPIDDGPAAGESIDPEEFDRMLEAYYAMREWGENGRPTRACLDRLDLLDVVDEATPLDDPWTDAPFDPERHGAAERLERSVE
ncbi:Aldehyde:ferredoxin oxidoreductase [Halalkaliarchaeum sp. AArc-CO]|uniref:aldehyde ferredoxin oxidoreductase family protein n=1 Tax=unclassified Halalkaliarchaeum TaxID=2678344 RepID=UPI00217E70A9|nr:MULTISPECIES: aldehyde ferredoxin oxidoreductase C-terminal domain-containing protein [unclassified Halalkaliarchaeum]MDR5674583.1 aldehyde ferredoxin oxidoreductase C-terminal domain-containing protein [Halalkaliarchaeum sp. AArc-GB]UWG52146.1 Aldehyde:ferredoxin oxidoreductase [Halalkaliarchaeum sp. AArc-CO]